MYVENTGAGAPVSLRLCGALYGGAIVIGAYFPPGPLANDIKWIARPPEAINKILSRRQYQRYVLVTHFLARGWIGMVTDIAKAPSTKFSL